MERRYLLVFAALLEALAIYEVFFGQLPPRSIIDITDFQWLSLATPIGLVILTLPSVFKGRFSQYKKLGWSFDFNGPDLNLRVHRYIGSVWISFQPEGIPIYEGIGYGHAYCMVSSLPEAEAVVKKLESLFVESEISGDVVILRKPGIVFDKVEFPKLLTTINERLGIATDT